MYCKYCGAENKDGASFCASCGAPLKRSSFDQTAKQKNENTTNTQATKSETNTSYSSSTPPNTNSYYQYSSPNSEPIRTDRTLIAYIFLSIITIGIYALYYIYALARDINKMCAGDGLKTGGLGAVIGYTIISCGAYGTYWGASIVDRLAVNGSRYGVNIEETGISYILWNFPGVLLCFTGPFVAMNIIIKNTNKIAEAYNAKYHLQ